jgi:hypothetical protein
LISLPEFTGNFLLWSAVMFKNLLKTTWGILRRSKGFSFINVTGLAVGRAHTTAGLYLNLTNLFYRICVLEIGVSQKSGTVLEG